MKKRFQIPLIILTGLLVLVVAAFVVLTATTTTGQLGDDVYFAVNAITNTAVIYGNGEMWHYSYDLSVYPPGTDTDSLRGPSPLTLDHKDTIQKLIIMDGVTNISFMALAECAALETIYVPEPVREIWFGAFWGCHNLSEIHFEGDTPEPVLPDYAEDTAANTFCSDYFFQKDFPTIYYSGGTAGWDTEIWNGFTTIAEEYKIDWSPMK